MFRLEIITKNELERRYPHSSNNGKVLLGRCKSPYVRGNYITYQDYDCVHFKGVTLDGQFLNYYEGEKKMKKLVKTELEAVKISENLWYWLSLYPDKYKNDYIYFKSNNINKMHDHCPLCEFYKDKKSDYKCDDCCLNKSDDCGLYKSGTSFEHWEYTKGQERAKYALKIYTTLAKRRQELESPDKKTFVSIGWKSELTIGDIVEVNIEYNQWAERIFIKHGKDNSIICVDGNSTEDYKEGDTFDTTHWNKDEWRIKQEKKEPTYWPFTWEERDELKGKWVKRKSDNFECLIQGFNNDKKAVELMDFISKPILTFIHKVGQAFGGR